MVSVDQVRGRSVVREARARSPLQLLNPKNFGHAAWVYVSSLGGGLVGRDEVALEARVQVGSTLFLSSQSSTKVYRGARSSFSLTAQVETAATMVAWPEPVACFAGSALRQLQRFELAQGSSLLLVDAYTCGRAARGERWAFDRLESRVRVDVAGRPWLREGLLLEGAHGALGARLRGVDAFGTVVVVGPAFERLCVELEREAQQPPLQQDVLATVSPKLGGAVVRLLSPKVEPMLLRLRQLLGAEVEAVLGEAPPTFSTLRQP
jgi:urease accessory protein